jgi:hypothetical protein
MGKGEKVSGKRCQAPFQKRVLTPFSQANIRTREKTQGAKDGQGRTKNAVPEAIVAS